MCTAVNGLERVNVLSPFLHTPHPLTHSHSLSLLSASSPTKRASDIYPLDNMEKHPLNGKDEDGGSPQEESSSLDDSPVALTPHSKLRVRWRDAAMRTLDQVLEIEEDGAESQPESPLRGGMHSSHERPSQLDLGGKRKAPQRATKSGFLREGDTHSVWKGTLHTKGPQLADIALVALQKKHENDLLERQRYLKDRIAATQAALKDQTETLLYEDEDEEGEKDDNDKEEVEANGQDVEEKQKKRRITFKQGATMVRDSIRRKRKTRATPLSDLVDQYMKKCAEKQPSARLSPSTTHAGSSGNSVMRSAITPGPMRIEEYRAMLRQQRRSQWQMPVQDVSQSARFVRMPPARLSPRLRRSSSAEYLNTWTRDPISPLKNSERERRPPRLTELRYTAHVESRTSTDSEHSRQSAAEEREATTEHLPATSQPSQDGDQVPVSKQRSTKVSQEPAEAAPQQSSFRSRLLKKFPIRSSRARSSQGASPATQEGSGPSLPSAAAGTDSTPTTYINPLFHHTNSSGDVSNISPSELQFANPAFTSADVESQVENCDEKDSAVKPTAKERRRRFSSFT